MRSKVAGQSKKRNALKLRVAQQKLQIAQLQMENENLKATLRIMGGELHLTDRKDDDRGGETAIFVFRIPLPHGWNYSIGGNNLGWSVQLHRKKP